MGMDGGEDAEFADHVVGFGRDGAKRGAAEDGFMAGGGEVVSEIGVAAGELGDGDGGELEPGGEGGEGEFFSWTDGAGNIRTGHIKAEHRERLSCHILGDPCLHDCIF